jgi:hypothetical protein
LSTPSHIPHLFSDLLHGFTLAIDSPYSSTLERAAATPYSPLHLARQNLVRLLFTSFPVRDLFAGVSLVEIQTVADGQMAERWNDTSDDTYPIDIEDTKPTPDKFRPRIMFAL